MTLKTSRKFIAVAALCLCASHADAGGLAEPVVEAPVAQPQEPFEPAQGSVNGGYIMLGALLLMGLATAAAN